MPLIESQPREKRYTSSHLMRHAVYSLGYVTSGFALLTVLVNLIGMFQGESFPKQLAGIVFWGFIGGMAYLAIRAQRKMDAEVARLLAPVFQNHEKTTTFIENSRALKSGLKGGDSFEG